MSLTWVQMRWSVGCRDSGPHSPRYWVSMTRSPFRHDASAPPRKSSKPQPGGPWGESQGGPPTVQGLAETTLAIGLIGPNVFHAMGEVPHASPHPIYLLHPKAGPVTVPPASPECR